MKKYLPTVLPILTTILIAVLTDKLTKIDILGQVSHMLLDFLFYLGRQIQTPIWILLLLIFVLQVFGIWQHGLQPAGGGEHTVRSLLQNNQLSKAIIPILTP